MSNTSNECVFASALEAGPNVLLPEELTNLTEEQAEQLGEERITELLDTEVCPASREPDEFMRCALRAGTYIQLVMANATGSLPDRLAADQAALAEMPVTCAYRAMHTPIREQKDTIAAASAFVEIAEQVLGNRPADNSEDEQQ